MPFSKSSFDQKLQTAWKNPPYWYQFLSPADKLVYNGLFPNLNEIIIPGLYPFIEEGSGLVDAQAANYCDIYDTLSPATAVAPGSFPDVIRTGVVGGTVNLTSTNAQDTNVAGTGLRKVVVFGLSITNGDFRAEIVNMNGIANVSTVQIYSALKVQPIEYGGNGTPAGVITSNDGVKDIFQIATFNPPSSAWIFNPINASITMRTVITSIWCESGENNDVQFKYKMFSPLILTEFPPTTNGTRLEFELSKNHFLEGIAGLFPMAKDGSGGGGNTNVRTRITGYRIQL